MQDAKWFQSSYRRNLVDMHIDDWDESFLAKFDPHDYVEKLKTARVKSAMVYANSHIGLCYWPTESGQMHRGLRGRDAFGEIVGLCRKEGIDVVAYYSLIFNNWAYEQHADWRILYEGGTPSRQIPPLGRYGVVCPNNAAYREFVDAQVKEVCTGYELDGIFFDMTFWPGVCFCAACRERYEREASGDMPSTINWRDAQWVAFQKRREAWLLEFAAFATETAKRYRPGITVEHNSAPLTQPWFLGTTIGLRDHNDYIGGDLYGGFGEQSFICKLYHSITPNQPFEFMTSRCYPNLRDHTTMKSREMLEVHAYLAMAHNGAFFFIDAIDPAGTMNPKVYETMGEVFGCSQEYERHLGGELCQDIAIYFSFDSKMDPEDNGKPANLGGNKVPHLDAALGAARTLREKHMPFGVISGNGLENAGRRHKAIILPEVLVLSEEEADALRRFVESGGGLYASGRTDLTHLGDVFGITTEGETSATVTYITPTARGRELLQGVDPGYPLSVSGASASLGGSSLAGAVGSGRQVKARAANEDEVMATLTLPYSTVRLVVNPEKMVIKEAQRSFTYLNLYGYVTDAVVCNRLLPKAVADTYFSRWRTAQRKYQRQIEEAFSPLPVLTAPLLEHEVVGQEGLRDLAQRLFGDDDPTRIYYPAVAQEVRSRDGEYVLSLGMPFVEKEDISVSQRGDELSITVGSYKRQVLLPRALAGRQVTSAKMDGNRLTITFVHND